MDHAEPKWKRILERILYFAIRLLSVVLLLVLVLTKCGRNGDKQKVRQTTTSDLIRTEELSLLSVCEYAYNGIVQDGDDHIMYKSTVKVSADPEKIRFTLDEENKKIVFVIPELTVEEPVIDMDSLRFMDKGQSMEIYDAIRICKNDAFRRAKASDKLLSSAKENLEAVIEAWYSSVLEGYTFEFRDGGAEGGGDP